MTEDQIIDLAVQSAASPRDAIRHAIRLTLANAATLDNPQCPKCKSDQTMFQTHLWHNFRGCNACGHAWEVA